MNSESPPKLTPVDELAPQQEQNAALEVKKLGWLERGKIARDMLIKPVIANGLNKMREVDVKGLMNSAVGAASTGKDHIVHAGVAAGMMALDVSGLEDAHIVGESHKLVRTLGKTLTSLGAVPAGFLFIKTAGLMESNPEFVARAEKRMEDALHAKIKSIREHGAKND